MNLDYAIAVLLDDLESIRRDGMLRWRVIRLCREQRQAQLRADRATYVNEARSLIHAIRVLRKAAAK